MKRILILLLCLTGSAVAQYTSVTATGIHDVYQVSYAGGKVNATLPQGEVFSGTGLQPPNTASATLDENGAFTMRLAANDQLSPSGSQWSFNVCSSANTGCFTVAITISGTSQNISSTLNAAAGTIPAPTDNVRLFKLQAAPSQNPPSDFVLLYGDSGTGNLTCLTSSGASCLSGGGGGGATFQVNGVNTANQSTINFQDSAVFNGVTFAFSNPSVGNIKIAPTGTFANTALANSIVTVNTTSPLGGGGPVALGASITLTCTSCATSSNNLSFFSSTTSAQLAGVISDETGTGVLVFSDSPVFTTQIKSPVFVSGAADPADAGVVRFGNAEIIAWEANPAGTDATLGVDTSNILQSSVAFNAPTLTEGGSAVPNSTDNLGFFASTTSAQFLGVISNETGTGLVMGNNTPSITTPVISNTVVGSLGAATTLGKVSVVTDGLDKTDCTVGGGSTIVWCIASGSVWTSAAASAGGAGANTTLSNLGTTAANANISPGTDNSIDLGDSTHKWRTLYIGTSISGPSISTSGTNGGFDGVEGTGAGLTAAGGHDLMWPDSTAHRWKVNDNNAGADTLAVFTDNLSVFAATTSAQLRGVLSDESGTGVAIFGTAPTFTTSITTPVVISGSGDPADAGFIRMGNAEVIGWENATPGTDLTITMNASNVFTVSTPVSATTGFQIGGTATSAHYLRGNGTNYVDSAIQAGDLPAGTTTTIASGTSALGTSSIGSGACATTVTTTATGTATTDAIIWTPNADITAVTGYAPSTSGSVIIYPFPTANNVNWKVCNPTTGSITPGAVTLNWRVVR